MYTKVSSISLISMLQCLQCIYHDPGTGFSLQRKRFVEHAFLVPEVNSYSVVFLPGFSSRLDLTLLNESQL